MRVIIAAMFIFTIILVGHLHSATAADEFPDAEQGATINALLERARTRKLIAGGVVLVGNHAGLLYSTARGHMSDIPGAAALDEHTLFDLASLTKVLATTPAVMKLLEAGRMTLTDPLTRWFPEFQGSGREDITILNLMTHTSGLNDLIVPANDPMNLSIRQAAAQGQWHEPGSRFRYADINFILLGELVRRVSGMPLDLFCSQQIFSPLGLTETMFRPPPQLAAVIAPTLGTEQPPERGIVQDMNARRLGGVAGHAGLFASAADLARFARLILCGGVLDGERIFSERTVAQMTAPYFYSNGRVVRGLGWDIDSPYSAPRGSHFSSMSFGHTGYSGSSLWIDPQRDLFVIVLTVRLDYRNIGLFNRLRRDISTIAVTAFPSGNGSLESGQRRTDR